MPLLAAWIGNLVASIVSFFTLFLTKRIAIVAAVIAAAVAITTAFVAAMQGVIAGLVYAAPSELVLAWGWLVPDNLDNCIAAVVAGQVIRWGYDWNIKVIQYKLI